MHEFLKAYHPFNVMSKGAMEPPLSWLIFPGGHSGEETPVPIPNTEVKLPSADGTALATGWESRALPGFFIYPR